MSTAAIQEQLLERAARLGEIARALGLSKLAESIESDTERRLQDSRIRAVVVGEIKQGKSTLINAILKRPALPTGVTPTTGAVVVVHAGDAPGTYLEHEDGRRDTLDPERFSTLAKGRPQGEKGGSSEGRLELVVSGEELPEALELVDTPGINDIAAYRAAVARGELPRADILVLVLDATQLLNRTEMAFLRDAVSSVGGLDTSGAKLLIVVNRADLIDPAERPSLVEHLEKELASLAPPAKNGNKIYELFSTDAKRACKEPDADDPTVESVRELRRRLIEMAEHRESVLPNRARTSLVRASTLLAHHASIASRAITLDLEALRKEIETLRAEFASQESDMATLREMMDDARTRILDEHRRRTEGFRDGLSRSVETAIESANHRTLTSLLPGSIQDAYLVFARGEAERLRTELDELTRKVMHTHGEQARRRLAQAALRLGFSGPPIYLDPPSFAVEAGLVAIGVAGTAIMYFGSMVPGMLMTIAGPLATVILREKSLRDARTRARAELPKALDRATEAVHEQIRDVVDGHLAALDEHLMLANVALRDQLTEVLESSAERLDGRTTGLSSENLEERRSKSVTELRGLEHALMDIRGSLEKLRIP